MKKRILALMLAAMMILPCFHITVSAAANPYTEVPATTYDRSLSVAGGSNTFQDMANRVGSVWHYSYLAYPLDFGDTPPSHMEITASAHANYADTVVVRLDSPSSGEIIAEIMFEKLGFGTASTSKIALEKRLTGEHTIYITTKKSTMNFHSFRFIAPKEETFTYEPYTTGGAYTDLEAGSVASAADLLWQLGMIQDASGETFSPDAIVSRGWFANAVYAIYKERASGAYVEQEGVTYETGFKDVSSTSPYAEAIKFLSEQGIVNGTEDKCFSPHQYMQTLDAVVVLLRVLGYEQQAELSGGYPNGYLKVARQAGIFSGNSADVLSRGDAAVLLAKAIKGNYLSFASLKAPDIVRYEKLEGILGVYRGLQYGEGKVTATPASGLSLPKTGLANTQVEIGGVLYDIGKTNAISLLGYDCEFYYKEELGGRVLYAIAPNGNVEIETISSTTHDISGVSDDEIVYVADGDDENEIIEIKKGTNIFYNCVAIEGALTEVVQNEDSFKGTITFIENPDGSRAIFIEEYEDYIIEAIDLEGMSFDSDGGTRKVSWKADDTIVIIDAMGDELLMTDVETDSVATVYQSRNTTGIKVIRIYLADAEMEGKVTAIKDGKTYVDGKEVVISNSLTDDMGVGREGVFRLNIYGDIVDVRVKEPNAWQVGLFMAYAKEETGFETIPRLKIMTTEPKENAYDIASTLTADGIRLKDGTDIINGVATSDGTWIGLKNIEAETAVRYRLNDEGKVYQIDTPATGADSAEDTLKCIFQTTAALTYYRTPGLVVMQSDGRGALYMENTATVMSFYGEDAHSEKNCVAGPATTIISRTEYDPYGTFYSTSGNDYVADLFVWPDCTSSLSENVIRFVYTHTSQGVDANGDIVTLINGYTGGREAAYVYNKNGDVALDSASINILDNLKIGDVLDAKIIPNTTTLQGATLWCLADGVDSRMVDGITITPKVCKTTTSTGVSKRGVLGTVIEKGDGYIIVQTGKDASGKPIIDTVSAKTAGVYCVSTAAARAEAAVKIGKFSNISVGDVVFTHSSSGACDVIVIFEDATM